MNDFFCLHHIIRDVKPKTLVLCRRIIFFLTFSLCLFSLSASSQIIDTIHFINYNLLNYPAAGGSYSADTTARHPHYRTIFNSLNADIIVVQEINSQTGIDGLLSNVLNATNSIYSAGPFINGYDTDNGIFFKTDKFHSPSNTAIQTELRDINEFKLVHTLSGDTLRIYSLHLKASSGSSNEAQRAREIDSLRKVTNLLPAGTNFIVCGDFNIYNSTESAYQKLLQVSGPNEGHFIDPISMPGTWNQFAYRSHHTQSPRVRAFGGGSTGGLDDRFDLILFSQAINDPGGMEFVPNSQIPYGNDGDLYNDSINNPSNSSVSPAIANALHYGSDHLPVMSQFTIEYNLGSTPTDFGVTALLDPQSPMCSNGNQTMAVMVKNFGSLMVDFSTSNLDITLQVSTPSSGTQVFTESLTSGSINAGAVMTINFASTLDMSVAGTYSFKCYTTQANDANHGNDTLFSVPISVTSSTTASISPAGPILMCDGDSTTLTASAGISYLWSNGSTSQNIIVHDTGSYSVEVTIAGGCSSSSNTVEVSFITAPVNGVVFYESMGTVSGTTSIAGHEAADGFDNDNYTMSGTGDVRVTSASSGYSGASGGANVFFTAPGRIFTISGINTIGYTNLQLSHGMHKNQIASDGSDLIVEISVNGIDFTPLQPALLNTGSGTATWHYRTVSGTIPQSASLSIQFRHSNNTTQFRVDDITLSGTTGSPMITASGPLTFCQGDSVLLTAPAANHYHWNTGATTQAINVNSSGTYYATVDCFNTDTATVLVSNCQDVTLNLKTFIQGFYIGNQTMVAVADPISNPGICDTITVELAEPISPYGISHSVRSVLAVDGAGSFVFPPSVINNSYFIVVKHRNSLETWSTAPVSFNSLTINYDFTTSASKAYGGNLANMDGEFCLYSGDIYNGLTAGVQDGIIDTLDYSLEENALLLFISGYSLFDLTGDGIVESSDYSLVGTNVSLGVFLMRP